MFDVDMAPPQPTWFICCWNKARDISFLRCEFTTGTSKLSLDSRAAKSALKLKILGLVSS